MVESTNEPKLNFYDLGTLQGCPTWNELWAIVGRLYDVAYSQNKRTRLSFAKKHNFGRSAPGTPAFDEKYDELEAGAEREFDNILTQRYGGIRVPNQHSGLPKGIEPGFLIEAKDIHKSIVRKFVPNAPSQQICYLGVVPRFGVPMGFTLDESVALPNYCLEICVYDRDYPEKGHAPKIRVIGKDGLPLVSPKLLTYGEDRILEVGNLQWNSVQDWYRMKPTVKARIVKIGRPVEDIFMADEPLADMKSEMAGEMDDSHAEVWQ